MKKRMLVLALAASLFAVAPAYAKDYTVHIRDFAYKPAPLAIAVGDTVTFINDDQDAHTVTATDGTFDSKGLDTSSTWKHTFTKRGKFSYFCQLHPYMKSTIVVK